jgi:hypothetical protein
MSQKVKQELQQHSKNKKPIASSKAPKTELLDKVSRFEST